MIESALKLEASLSDISDSVIVHMLGMKLNGLGMKLNGMGMKLNGLGMKLRNDTTMTVVKWNQALTCAGYNVNTSRYRSRPASIEQARNGCIS